ncbi:AmmeMemoRadiSam system protein B [Pseudothermotoga thermarum]|uniref:MEMO1 family protein Theth_0876 n=1 Tax=Pseudothermotoga thermarum DSM 5069 TaxID=688269 RepID=F7YX58_9THEM|nr:AmmeMemoRadiSam system protein B [Pseudothermotoga thermarum]AEH50960.1 protein of unknown function DUF52 [Pseudothermotoga thermarum DSM 5069]
MIRYPVVAGTFYPGSPTKLRQTIMDLITSPLGPGNLDFKVPVTQPLNKNVGIIVPHAGYVYSGPIAVHAYVAAARLGKPNLVVLIGPNHTGRGAKVGVWDKGSWLTPLGKVEVDEQASKLLFENCEVCKADFDSHLLEHSLEVQLPFLQFFFDEFKILPISIFPVSIDLCKKIAAGLDAIASEYKNTLFVVSTDFNHYENQDVTIKKDQMAIEKIEAKDPIGLVEVVDKYDISMCGVSAVASFLYMKTFGKPKLLCHATSGDVSKDFLQVVGYASFICEAA